MGKSVKLDKRWKEIIFAGAGFGPNLLMVLMMAYFTDAIMPSGLNADVNFWSYGGVTIVFAVIFPILWTIGRFFDGIIDVPLAHLTDSLKNKKGKRFITILISFLPMTVSFVLCWIPVFGKSADITTAQQVGNSIWIFFWSLVFFASYTLALITFYGSLSEVCENQTQRARVSAYKSVFDTISYALVYAAIPAIFKAINIPIVNVALYLSPLMLTILIPYLFRKEGATTEATPEENVPLGESIALTFKSRAFMKWQVVNCVSFFGLQMFLVAQNTLISGIMNLGAGWAAVLNTCAFAPVPLMLFIFNKLRRKKGLRFVYQTCLLSFAVAILSFLFGSQYFWGDQIAPKVIIGAVGGIFGSWGIGAFFMMPYLIPTVIASVEEEVTKKNHSAMYFAVQALTTSIVGAIASSLIYNYLKLWTRDGTSAGQAYNWKCGVSIAPLIVAVFCLAGFFLCYLMPKNYTAKAIYGDLLVSAQRRKVRYEREKEKLNRQLEERIAQINSYDISEKDKEVLIADFREKQELAIARTSLKIVEQEKIINYKFDITQSSANEEKEGVYEEESYLGNICLYFLSVGVYGIFAVVSRFRKLKALGIKLSGAKKALIIIGLIVPLVSIVTNVMVENMLANYMKEHNISYKKKTIALVITSMLLPMFLNVYDMYEKDVAFNTILKAN